MSNEADSYRLTAEGWPRLLVDWRLTAAGCSARDKKAINLLAARSPSGDEVMIKAGHFRFGHLLCINQYALGVTKATREGTALSGVQWQSATDVAGLPARAGRASLPKNGRYRLPSQASLIVTRSTRGYEPGPRARRLVGFEGPELDSAGIA